MDQELEKKTKKLEEEPEDSNLKSNIFTEESKVCFPNNLLICYNDYFTQARCTLKPAESLSSLCFHSDE